MPSKNSLCHPSGAARNVSILAAIALGIASHSLSPSLVAQGIASEYARVREHLSTMRKDLDAEMTAQIQPLIALRAQLNSALAGLNLKATAENDEGLLVAVQSAQSDLENGKPFPTTVYPELEKLRTIFQEQTEARKRLILSNMTNTLRSWKSKVSTQISKLPANKFGQTPHSHEYNNFLDTIDELSKRVAQGDTIWSSGDDWADVFEGGYYHGTDRAERVGSGIVIASTTSNANPRLRSYIRSRLPMEVEATVVSANAPFFIDVGGLQILFRNEEVPGKLKFLTPGPKGGWEPHFVDCNPLPEGELQKFQIKVEANLLTIKCNDQPLCETALDERAGILPLSLGVRDQSRVEVRSFKFRSVGNLRYHALPQQRSTESMREFMEVTTPSVVIPIRSIGASPQSGLASRREERPEADKNWPTTLALFSPPNVEVTVSDPKSRTFIYKSPNYQFVCDAQLSLNVVREFGRIFEATHLVNCKMPLDIRPEPEVFKPAFTARIFSTDEAYYRQGGAQGSAGVYVPSLKSIMVPISSLGVKLEGNKVTIDTENRDFHTLIHEITHQMMNRWLEKLPIWLIEGSAEYVAWSTYKQGKFDFTEMRKNLPEKLSRRGISVNNAPIPNLENLMNLDHAKWAQGLGNADGSGNYAGAGLLAYYFYRLDEKKDGANIVAFFKSVRNGMPHTVAVQTHLLRGRSYEQLQLDVATAFEAEGVVINFKPKA